MPFPYEHDPQPPEDVYPVMSSPNEAGEGTKYELLAMPETVDEAWCDIVTQVYQHSEKKVRIISGSCLRQVLNSAQPEAKLSYQLVDINLVDGKTPGIEGTIAGIKLWPVWNERLEHQDQPHVVVKNAVVEGQNAAISQTPEQEVLIPLDPGLRQLILFS